MLYEYSCFHPGGGDFRCGGRPWWLLEREGLVSVGALKPLGQKHTVWIRTGNLTKCTALTTEPRLPDIIRNETLRFMKLKCKKKNIADQKHVEEPCCYALTLVQGSAMKIWLGVINEMCLQGLSLSSTKDTV